jgi:CheY-like chemotaxis protein
MPPSKQSPAGDCLFRGMSDRVLILWAEDQEFEEFMMRRAVAKAGVPLELLRVPDGVEALAYLQGQPPYEDRSKYPFPCLLLLDLKMPRMGGFDVLAWLQTQPSMEQLPVVVFSSSSYESDEREALALGADEYRVKPNAPDELVTVVKQLYGRCVGGALKKA